jgi:hypothetical protein
MWEKSRGQNIFKKGTVSKHQTEGQTERGSCRLICIFAQMHAMPDNIPEMHGFDM